MVQPQAPEKVASPSRGQVAYATSLLAMVSFFNYLDRYGMSILVEPIKAELNLSDTQMGLLTGFAFTATYGLFGLPLARWADQRSRVRLLALCLAVWSIATAVMSVVTSFSQMVLARVVVGIGEAGGNPASHSLIGDYYPAETRARGLSLFQLGGIVGGTLGIGLVGYAADQLGWRVVMLGMGLLGLPLALIILFTLKEPPRGRFQLNGMADEPISTWFKAVQVILRRRTMRHLLVAFALVSFGTLGVAAWSAPFFMRVHELSLTEVGIVMGSISGLSALLGAVLGAVMAPALVKRDRRWELWWPALVYLVGWPLHVIGYTADSLWLVYSALAFATFLIMSAAGLINSAVQSVVPSTARAMSISLIMIAGILVGGGSGPLLVGALSDALFSAYGDQGLRYALVIATTIMTWGVAHFMFAARHLRGELTN